MNLRSTALLLLFAFPIPTHAIEVRVSSQALERTLRNQLFTTPANPTEPARYYIRGSATTACSVSVDSPRVSFTADRITVHVHTRARFGTSVRGACIGVSLSNEADVSFIPEAEGESVGFRDARIDRLSGNKELDFLLVPFLSRKLPAQMKVNAADLMRTLLAHSPEQTGYTLTLSSLKLHSMLVQDNALVLDLDANMHVD